MIGTKKNSIFCDMPVVEFYIMKTNSGYHFQTVTDNFSFPKNPEKTKTQLNFFKNIHIQTIFKI